MACTCEDEAGTTEIKLEIDVAEDPPPDWKEYNSGQYCSSTLIPLFKGPLFKDPSLLRLYFQSNCSTFSLELTPL